MQSFPYWKMGTRRRREEMELREGAPGEDMSRLRCEGDGSWCWGGIFRFALGSKLPVCRSAGDGVLFGSSVAVSYCKIYASQGLSKNVKNKMIVFCQGFRMVLLTANVCSSDAVILVILRVAM
jgi:hypothetical protein